MIHRSQRTRRGSSKRVVTEVVALEVVVAAVAEVVQEDEAEDEGVDEASKANAKRQNSNKRHGPDRVPVSVDAVDWLQGATGQRPVQASSPCDNPRVPEFGADVGYYKAFE